MRLHPAVHERISKCATMSPRSCANAAGSPVPTARRHLLVRRTGISLCVAKSGKSGWSEVTTKMRGSTSLWQMPAGEWAADPSGLCSAVPTVLRHFRNNRPHVGDPLVRLGLRFGSRQYSLRLFVRQGGQNFGEYCRDRDHLVCDISRFEISPIFRHFHVSRVGLLRDQRNMATGGGQAQRGTFPRCAQISPCGAAPRRTNCRRGARPSRLGGLSFPMAGDPPPRRPRSQSLSSSQGERDRRPGQILSRGPSRPDLSFRSVGKRPSRVVHTHEIAGSSPAAATKLGAVRPFQSCGPP